MFGDASYLVNPDWEKNYFILESGKVTGYDSSGKQIFRSNELPGAKSINVDGNMIAAYSGDGEFSYTLRSSQKYNAEYYLYAEAGSWATILPFPYKVDSLFGIVNNAAFAGVSVQDWAIGQNEVAGQQGADDRQRADSGGFDAWRWHGQTIFYVLGSDHNIYWLDIWNLSWGLPIHIPFAEWHGTAGWVGQKGYYPGEQTSQYAPTAVPDADANSRIDATNSSFIVTTRDHVYFGTWGYHIRWSGWTIHDNPSHSYDCRIRKDYTVLCPGESNGVAGFYYWDPRQVTGSPRFVTDLDFPLYDSTYQFGAASPYKKTDVTVTVTNVEEIRGDWTPLCDIWFWEHCDYYTEIVIDGTFFPSTTYKEQNEIWPEDWSFTKTVDLTGKEVSLGQRDYMVVTGLNLYDSNEPGAPDKVDISPSTGHDSIKVGFLVNTGLMYEWFYREWITSPVEGNEGIRAKYYFQITHSPFELNGVTISSNQPELGADGLYTYRYQVGNASTQTFAVNAWTLFDIGIMFPGQSLEIVVQSLSPPHQLSTSVRLDDISATTLSRDVWIPDDGIAFKHPDYPLPSLPPGSPLSIVDRPDFFTVNNHDDSGVGSLRLAIQVANGVAGPDVINITDVGPFISTGGLRITDDITINGPGASDLILNGRGGLIFDITSSTNQVRISDLTLWGRIENRGNDLKIAQSTISNADYRAILNVGGTVDVSASTLHDNQGDAIFNTADGIVSIENSTVSGNEGRGIVNNHGTVFINNTTVTDNVVSGIHNEAVVRLGGSIIAHHASGSNCIGFPMISDGYNLDSDGSCRLLRETDLSHIDPLLEPLSDYAGGTLTHALQMGSPAIDRMPVGANGCGTAIISDQRGRFRPQIAGCDSGAFEFTPNSIKVTNTFSDGQGSLRQAIQDANAAPGPDVIEFERVSGTIYAPYRDINGSLSINGPGASQLTIAGAGSEIFEVLEGVVRISGLTLEGSIVNLGGELTIADTTITGSRGIAVHNLDGGSILVANTTISHNDQWSIWNDEGSSLTLINSTVSGNGNAFMNSLSGLATVISSTITGSATNGLANFGVMEVSNSIIANQAGGVDCKGSFTSLGYNLDSDGTCALSQATDLPGTDPLLKPLTDNGGAGDTHGLIPDSPALDHIPVSENGCGTTILMDQRGVARPQDSGCDIGTFESTSTGVDSDGDGLSDGDETMIYRADPSNSDTDGDGLKDGREVNVYHTNPSNSDTDADGLSDNDELAMFRTDPLLRDTDSDGLTDGEEVILYPTDPTLDDTDGDSVSDSTDNCMSVPNTSQRDSDTDGYGNYCDPDFDNNSTVDFADLAYMKSAFFGNDPLTDLNGDAKTDFADLAILKAMFFGSPGPSALAD